MTAVRVSPPSSRHVCTFCGQTFSITAEEKCPRVCDGGLHESTTVHVFKPGRRDGLCAEPTEGELMCGFAENDERLHVG